MSFTLCFHSLVVVVVALRAEGRDYLLSRIYLYVFAVSFLGVIFPIILIELSSGDCYFFDKLFDRILYEVLYQRPEENEDFSLGVSILDCVSMCSLAQSFVFWIKVEFLGMFLMRISKFFWINTGASTTIALIANVNTWHVLLCRFLRVFFLHQHWPLGFHWILRDSNSHQVSRTLLSILADQSNTVVLMLSVRPLISNSSNPFTALWRTLQVR